MEMAFNEPERATVEPRTRARPSGGEQHVGSAAREPPATWRVPARDDALAGVLSRSVARRVLARAMTPCALHAFGNASSPRAPRQGSDYDVDTDGNVVAQDGPTPKGASTFGDPTAAPLTGHYHRVEAAVQLPAGLDVVADGTDVGGTQLPTHHSVYPTESMTVEAFSTGFTKGIGWKHAGKR
jgi:hypothetical protein